MSEPDPIAVIARITGETPDEVRAALIVLGELGYDFDQIWDLLTILRPGDGVRLTDVAATQAPRAPNRAYRRAARAGSTSGDSDHMHNSDKER